MDEIKLKMLLSRYRSPYDGDRLSLDYRIKSEHIFSSTDECIEYLENVMNCVSMNPDDPKGAISDNFRSNPNFVINIIDEAITTIIYDIYRQFDTCNQDGIAYINHRIESFSKFLADKSYTETSYNIIKPCLKNMMDVLATLATPIYHKEESIYGQLARIYYSTMYTLYTIARPRSEYFTKLIHFYQKKCQ